MFWTIASFPACLYHVFLSHCREDRESLVWPLLNRLKAREIIAWVDRDDYPYGRDSRSALRDGVLRCRHSVFLITDSTLTQARGWAVQELAWAELLQANLTIPGGILQHVILPLFFVDRANPMLAQSVWNHEEDRGCFYMESEGDPVEWAEAQIIQFLEREETLRQEMANLARQDQSFRARLILPPGLEQRVTGSDPTEPDKI